jgi:hypothetical protein
MTRDGAPSASGTLRSLRPAVGASRRHNARLMLALDAEPAATFARVASC